MTFFSAGAETVQIDFTEGRLSLKLDPSGGLLKSFVELNNKVLDRFSATDRVRMGVHVCPGGDHDSTHSADVDYAGLLPADVAAQFLPLDRMGTTDDCGFSPFADDESTARDVAFAKIRARVEGTAMAASRLGIPEAVARS